MDEKSETYQKQRLPIKRLLVDLDQFEKKDKGLNVVNIDGCKINRQDLNPDFILKLERNLLHKFKKKNNELNILREKIQKTNDFKIKIKFKKELEKYYKIKEEIKCLQKYKIELNMKIQKNQNVRNHAMKIYKISTLKNRNEQCNILKNEMDKRNKIMKEQDDKRITDYIIEKNSQLWKQFDTYSQLFNEYNNKTLKPFNEYTNIEFENIPEIINDKIRSNNINFGYTMKYDLNKTNKKCENGKCIVRINEERKIY